MNGKIVEKNNKIYIAIERPNGQIDHYPTTYEGNTFKRAFPDYIGETVTDQTEVFWQWRGKYISYNLAGFTPEFIIEPVTPVKQPSIEAIAPVKPARQKRKKGVK